MTRDEAVRYLSAEFSSLEALTGTVAADHPDGYQTVIDNSLRGMGVEEADLSAAVVEIDVEDYLALLDYYALRRFWRILSTRADIEVDGVPIKRSQYFAQVKELLNDAAQIVASKGLVPDAVGSDGFEMGYINLDYLEPAQDW
jgi:hypothetical protein